MVKKTVRDQVYNLETYLKYVNDGDICENADVQRLAGNFDQREINEIVYTTLTGDHIPELILAECNEDKHTYIADGLQRTTMLKLFRYGNCKITSTIDNPIVEYMGKKRDENGHVIKNERGQVVLEETTFDIRNKTYEMLPDELKKEFNDFQIRVIIHEDCTMKRISDLIKRYNYQRPMTPSQKAFTYIDNFAVKTRAISNMQFFVECGGYTEKEKINGTIERVITESIMCISHFDNWKKSAKSVCEYLNQHSKEEEFDMFENIIERLGKIITKDFDNIFTSKNSFIWFDLFYEFSKIGLDDKDFVEFVKEFNACLIDKVVNGITYKDMEEITYSKLDKESGTKDKTLVSAKRNILKILMKEYFDDHKSDNEPISAESFIAEITNVDKEIVYEDMDFLNESLDALTLRTVKDESKLLDKENRFSLLAMMAYSYKYDIDLEEWMTEYAKNNDKYFIDQKRNYLHMKEDLEKFIKNKKRSA